jgi:membrane protein
LSPALVFLIALTSFFPRRLIEQMMASVGSLAPAEMTEILRTQMQSIAAGENGGLLTLGFAMAVWSSSAALVSLIDAFNRAYGIDEARPWWKIRLTAILLTIGLAVLVLVSFGLVIAGPALAEWLAQRTVSGPYSNGPGKSCSGPSSLRLWPPRWAY